MTLVPPRALQATVGGGSPGSFLGVTRFSGHTFVVNLQTKSNEKDEEDNVEDAPEGCSSRRIMLFGMCVIVE